MNATAPSSVEALTQQRAQLQAWLARLGDLGSEVPSHVAQRVRRDYEDRLHAVIQELSAHREAIVADLEARRAELEQADAQRVAAADNLEEARLRHLIGEIEDPTWETRRPGLESAVSAAEGEGERIRAEVERLDALLRDVSEAVPGESVAGEESPAAAEAEAAPEAGDAGEAEEPLPYLAGPDDTGRDTSDDTIPEYSPFAAIPDPDAPAGEDETTGFDLSWLDEVEASTAGPDATVEEPPAVRKGDPSADDFAFLEELDRAIAASTDAGDEAPRPAGASDPDRTLDADRAGMLLCKECGAINEPQLWYCEICGSEL